MANNDLFSKSTPGRAVPATDAVNHAGGVAYATEDSHALSQLACTGTLNSTFYASASDQLDEALKLAEKVPVETLARIAVYARRKGFMKDLPALLGAVLSRRDPKVWEKVFPRVVDDARMLRSFVQIVRSGRAGRKSLGSKNRALIQAWFDRLSGEQLFRQSVGQNPSMGDVIGLSHANPGDDAERRAVFTLLRDRPVDAAKLPSIVREYRAYREDPSLPQPNVPIEMIQDFMGPKGWVEFARRASLKTVLKNLTKFQKNGVFDTDAKAAVVATLVDSAQIERSKVLPYQILQAIKAFEDGGDPAVVRALFLCLENAVFNVPTISGQVYVCPDVSGSMGHELTDRKGQGTASRVRHRDIAALVSAGILRKNPGAKVIPFDTSIHEPKMRSGDTLMTMIDTLGRFGGGGTCCELPLAALNAQQATGDLVVYVSDNESWASLGRPDGYRSSLIGYGATRQGTSMMREWRTFKARNPKAKLVVIDTTPTVTSQVVGEPDILRIGGFSDEVFRVVAAFAEGGSSADRWMDEVAKIPLDEHLTNSVDVI